MSTPAANTAGEAPRDNGDWGRTVEVAACDKWPGLEHTAPDRGEPDWYDAIARTDLHADPGRAYGGLSLVRAGTPVEVKAARSRMQDGQSSRRGRWWIRERQHQRLLDAGGAYALGVYQPRQGVLALALVRATTVGVLATWSPCGPGHRADRAARVPWPAVFDPREV